MNKSFFAAKWKPVFYNAILFIVCTGCIPPNTRNSLRKKGYENFCSLTRDFQISHGTLNCSLSPSIIYYFFYEPGTLNNHYKCFTFRFVFIQMKQLFARQ